MELEVGMYVRTDNGNIGKIYEQIEDMFTYKDNNRDYITYGVSHNEIIKASFNIIDLIEVGDYVNGYKVKEVNNNLNEHKGTCNCLDTYLWCVNDLGKFEEIVIFENEIKSIVTKEQFEQMSYKVEK